MISTDRAMVILLERDTEKSNKMIDKLTPEDAKYLLKVFLKTVKDQTGGTIEDFLREN